jgi:hypothetical protein
MDRSPKANHRCRSTGLLRFWPPEVCGWTAGASPTGATSIVPIWVGYSCRFDLGMMTIVAA